MTGKIPRPKTGTDPMTQSGAKWCREHGRWECAAKKADHHASAVRGMAMCRHHVGKALDLAKTQGEANLLAWSAWAGRDQAPLDPGQVVMDQLRVAVMRADLYGELLRIQVADEEVGGLVGPTYAIGREGVRVETGERIRGLAAMEAEWRDRAVRFAKTAHDMGIDERHIELEQGRAEYVVTAFIGALAVLTLEATERDKAIRKFLTGIGRDPEVLETGGAA